MAGGMPGARLAALVDLDGDKDLDLIRVAQDGRTMWLRRDRNGLFAVVATVVPAVGQTTVAVAAGQLTPDSFADVVVAETNGVLRLLVNDGKGGVQQTNTLPALAGVFRPVVRQLLIADLDRANGPDVLVVIDSSAPQIYLNDGKGGFANPVAVSPSPRFAGALGTVGDFNQDGWVDFVLFAGKTAAVPVAFTNNGKGALLLTPRAFPSTTSVAAAQVAVGDTNADRAPDIVLTPLASGFRAPQVFVSATKAMSFTQVKNTGTLNLTSPRSLVCADLDGDGYDDVAAIESTGVLRIGRNTGKQQPGGFNLWTTTRTAERHAAVAVGDIEGNGSADLFVAGNGIEDGLLLADGNGGFVDVADLVMPVGGLNATRGACIDAIGSFDPDLILFDTAGSGTLLENVDGQGVFRAVDDRGQPTILPALPTTTYFGASAASLTGASQDALIVHGQDLSASPMGVRVLRRVWDSKAGRWIFVDETSTRFVSQGSYVRLLAAQVDGSGGDDLLGVDVYGQLWVHTNSRGVLGKATLVAKGLSTSVQLSVGHANPTLDLLPDIVVYDPKGTVRLFLRSSTSYSEVVLPKVPGRCGLLTDVTEDGRADLLIAGTANGMTVLAGNGLGGFSDATTSLIKVPAAMLTLFSSATDAVVLRGGAEGARGKSRSNQVIALGLTGGADHLLMKSGGTFSGAPLAQHGSFNTAGLLARDVDADRDLDLVSWRNDALPSVMHGMERALAQAGFGQPGLNSLLRVRIPNLSTMAVMATGAGLNHMKWLPFGVSRLNAPMPIYYIGPKSLGIDLSLNVPKNLKLAGFPLQIYYLDYGNNTLRLGNLEVLR